MTEGDGPARHLRLVRSSDDAPPASPPSRRLPDTYPIGKFANLFDLTGKSALIVGGGGGIGSAIAHALADHGARVAIADIDTDAARHVARSCRRAGTEGPLAVQIDVTNPEHVNQVVAAIEEEAGRIDILVNSAGIQIRKPVTEYTPDEWMKIINVNLSGVFYVTQAVARGMLERGYGRILSLGSVSSLLGHPHHAPYAATKGGIAIMTKSMATEWAPHGITVNAIGPTYTVTGLITNYIADPAERAALVGAVPIGRLGTPDDLVGAAVYLCSDAASFVTGVTLYVDGGRTAD